MSSPDQIALGHLIPALRPICCLRPPYVSYDLLHTEHLRHALLELLVLLNHGLRNDSETFAEILHELWAFPGQLTANRRHRVKQLTLPRKNREDNLERF